ALALMERGQDAHGRPHAGAEVEHGRAEAGRRILLAAVHAEEPREGLHHGLVAGTQPARAASPECPQRAEHQSRIEGEQHIGAEPQLLDDPGPEVLYHHVGLRDVAFEPRDRIWILQVEDDGALVHVDGVKSRAAAEREERAPRARLSALWP